MRPLAGMVMLALAAGLVLLTLVLWPLWPPAVLGVILASSVLVERRYRGGGFAVKPPADGPGWQPTDEKFIDEDSGLLMQVWYHPATGQRDYRRAGP